MTQGIDQKIINLLHTDPEAGMTLLIEHYMGLLWSACRLYLNNPEDVKECVQETLLTFYEQRTRFQEDKGTLKAYLYVIAKRKAIQTAKKNGFYYTETLDDNLLNGQDDINLLLERAVLNQALSKLREQDSRMIRMRYYEGMTCAEIAHAMNLPVETVKKRQQRSLKKLQRILIALAVLGILTACAAAAYHYRFSPQTGFQEENTAIWYEMKEDTITLETPDGEVKILSVIWKEQRLLLHAEFTNANLTDEEYSDITVLIGEEKRNAKKTSIGKGEGYPVTVKKEYFMKNSIEAFTFYIQGTACTIDMQPIGQYEYFQDIGNSQTHNGRTLVIKPSFKENLLTIDAYTYSEDIWKVIGLWKDESHMWNRKDLMPGYMFLYKDAHAAFPYHLHIPRLLLESETETPMIELPLPEQSVFTDIPFQIGTDIYHITEIQHNKGTYEYMVLDENQQETPAYGDEIRIKIEPEKLESNTKICGARATLGYMKTYYSYAYNSQTQKSTVSGEREEFRPVETNSHEEYLLLENPDTEAFWISFGITHPNYFLLEQIVLRIDNIYKLWNQSYDFTVTQ